MGTKRSNEPLEIGFSNKNLTRFWAWAKFHLSKMDKHSKFNKWLVSIIGVIFLLYFLGMLIVALYKFVWCSYF